MLSFNWAKHPGIQRWGVVLHDTPRGTGGKNSRVYIDPLKQVPFQSLERPRFRC